MIYADDIDKAFDAISKAPANLEQRLDLLKALAEYFHGPIEPHDGIDAEQLKHLQLPFPLRWWFQLAGHRSSILNYQNELIEPDELKPDNKGKILFYVENQGVYLWSTDSEGDDPPVWGRFQEPKLHFTKEGMSLSEFLIGVCLFEFMMQAPYGATASWLDQEELDRLRSTIPELPLTPWRWPDNPSRFYGRRGASMFSCPNNGSDGSKAFSAWIGSTTPEPVSFLKDIVNDQWDSWTLDNEAP